MTPNHVTIREVLLRDGLQLEAPIPLADKLKLLDAIAVTGVREVEATAFVSPTWLGTHELAFSMALYLGTAPIVLAVAIAWLGGRRALFWALVTTALLLMACGPFVGFTHPLVAFLPTIPNDLHQVPPGHVRGPYYWALELVPFLRVFRGAYRWIGVAEIALAVTVATGLAALRARLGEAAKAEVYRLRRVKWALSDAIAAAPDTATLMALNLDSGWLDSGW